MIVLSGEKPTSAGRICVLCGSSTGADLKYLAGAKLLEATHGWRLLGLIYGGTSVGLMDATGDAEVIGVLPPALQDREIAHQCLGEGAPSRKHART
ncbi:MAG TPA: hypothetical protein VK638_44330 [Edaphobacter sp.]|nr:hypothetical protein [Edaphobacter sp.]